VLVIKKNIIYILFLSMLFPYNNNEFIEYYAYSPSVNLSLSLNQKQIVENKVLGVQFDIFYNTNQLDMNELICPVDGATFEYSMIKDGWLRCIAFNLDGKSFSRSELSRLILASFSQKNNFYKHTNVEFKNFIVAGDYGEDISDQYKINSFRINFSGLKPKNTYIHDIENNAFKDSILISFEIHKASDVSLEVYDNFEVKRQTVVNEYMDIGIYHRYINCFDDFQERFSDGEYKIKLLTNYSLNDSAYVIYKKNKN